MNGYDQMIASYQKNAQHYAANMVSRAMAAKGGANFSKQNKLSGRQQSADIPEHGHRFDHSGYEKGHQHNIMGHGSVRGKKRRGFPQGSQKRGLGKGPLGMTEPMEVIPPRTRRKKSTGVGPSRKGTRMGMGMKPMGSSGKMMMGMKPMNRSMMGMGEEPMRMGGRKMGMGMKPMGGGKKMMMGGGFGAGHLKRKKISAAMKKHHMGY